MGLPTALLLARSKIKVYGYDIDHTKINSLKEGKLPFSEKGLKELFSEVKEYFQPVESLQFSDAFILTLPTPITKNKTCDISYVTSAVKSVCTVLKDNDLVILESTVSPGTTMNTVKPLLEKTGKHFFLSYVSEKAIPGNTIYEMQHNHRIIGGINKESAKKTKEIYSSFVQAPIHLTDCTTAETVKLLENTYRDVNIALSNELAKSLSRVHVNVWEAIQLANYHPRVHLHLPGPGVGGHCIAIDPCFLVNENTSLIKEARRINDTMPKYVVAMIENLLDTTTSSTVVLLGVSYKGNVDDDRESPTYTIKQLLESKGITVRLYDPLITNNPEISNHIENVTKNADCLVLVTDHNIFKKINPKNITNMNHKQLVDSRNILNHDTWEKAGFTVKILGSGKKQM